MDAMMEQIAKNWLKQKMCEFIDQFDSNGHKDEFYMSYYEKNIEVLDAFYAFIDKDAREKEQRRKLYEELKKEFE